MEVWKSLDFEGLEKYQVSNLGNIRNLNTGKILKQQKNIYNNESKTKKREYIEV